MYRMDCYRRVNEERTIYIFRYCLMLIKVTFIFQHLDDEESLRVYAVNKDFLPIL